ncbi:MAG: D-glycero-beta-D-manno-heptose 1-phosphate adenylyltransferase [Gammaproteobacteria bacterium]|nr:D-glycero-beta-D-manno-heptose 1-phosphate adenylyltransferase [Gammaproteobacteria bacterium]|tara:strand:+ start:151885 stop:152373 length:489 start_codon:yes stop_codon:yes gene_type:complete
MQLKNNKNISDIDTLKSICKKHQSDNKKIILTNGCFDILHAGHTYLLNEAKKLGDILVVAINTDDSIKKIKSKDRPINKLSDRSYVLSCLNSVDYIISFDEETPEKLICNLLPDILVKGEDYKGKHIAGEECLQKNGKKIILIQLIKSNSTTSIVNKIREKD